MGTDAEYAVIGIYPKKSIFTKRNPSIRLHGIKIPYKLDSGFKPSVQPVQRNINLFCCYRQKRKNIVVVYIDDGSICSLRSACNPSSGSGRKERMNNLNYTIFKIPKRSGGFRQIEAPNEELKQYQQKVLWTLRGTYKISPFAHAFQPYKNIVTMAMPHVGKKWVMRFDLEDFFPSITLEAYKKVAESYSKIVLNYELLVCCFYDFNDGKGMRLPQGAPTSPFLSNAYLFTFDWKMAWLCHRFDCDYSRYADDIVMSGDGKGRLVRLYIIAQDLLANKYALHINPKKTKFMHQSRRQYVCAIVVNKKINLPRKQRKNLRAEIFQQKNALPNPTKGRLAFQHMVLKTEKQTNSSREIIDSILLSKELKAP